MAIHVIMELVNADDLRLTGIDIPSICWAVIAFRVRIWQFKKQLR